MQVQMKASEVEARFTHPLLQPVKDFASVWFKHADLMTFHDPLAATTIFDDNICGFTRGKVEIELQSEKLRGVTHFTPNENSPHEIASTVNREYFLDHYFSVFK